MVGTARASPHPVVWFALYLPFGISAGYTAVTLVFFLHAAGLTVGATAAVVAAGVLPNTWKVAWSPLVDITLSAKAWFAISVIATAATTLALGLTPETSRFLPVLELLVVANSIAVSVSAMSADRFMAFDTKPEEKGRAGGWSQAGNLGGQGLGGGAGIWIAQHSGQPALASVVLTVATLACVLALPFVTEPGRLAQGRRLGAVLGEAVRDVIGLLRTRVGLLGCFICALPIGSGAAQNLFAAVAGDWGAGPDQVALVVGALSGVFAITGAIAGGYVCDRMDRKGAYNLFGFAIALVAFAMALAPNTPAAFLVLASAYNLAAGLCYAAYAAVVLEAIGHGAAATKFNLMSSISNAPILAVTLADGWAQSRWGSAAMLGVDGALGLAGIAVYVAVDRAARLLWPPRDDPA